MLKNNFFSILIALAILYLSLASPDKFDRIDLLDLPWLDKVVHSGMYFALTVAIFLGNRKLLYTRRSILTASSIPLFYGILMEILQEFTSARSGNIADAGADLAGIAFFVLLWLKVRALQTGRSDADKL